MRASIAIGLLLLAGAARADEPAHEGDAPPQLLAAGDALGLAVWGELPESPAPAADTQPAPPAALADE
jgi:hypothetical protein